jgi:AcrR family transcriptional regulator
VADKTRAATSDETPSDGPGEMPHVANDPLDDDDDLWPLFSGRLPGRRTTGQPGREQQIGQRIQHQQDRGGKTPRRASLLSRREIVAAAIKVADAEGAGAISMRRIARELNAGAMSLYWHVASKDELLDLMLDAIEAEQEFPAPTGDWRADLRAIAVTQRAVLHRHQWLMDFIGGRPPLGPNTLRNLERALAITGKLGLDTETAINVLGSVSTYVMGAVLREFRESMVERRDAEAMSRMPEAELREIMSAHVNRLRATGRYPNFLRIFDQGIDPDAAATRDARFEFGLDCLLDGIAARLP